MKLALKIFKKKFKNDKNLNSGVFSSFRNLIRVATWPAMSPNESSKLVQPGPSCRNFKSSSEKIRSKLWIIYRAHRPSSLYFGVKSRTADIFDACKSMLTRLQKVQTVYYAIFTRHWFDINSAKAKDLFLVTKSISSRNWFSSKMTLTILAGKRSLLHSKLTLWRK